MPAVLKLLDAAGVSATPSLRTRPGKGERGTRGGGELSGAFINSYVMTACPPEQSASVRRNIAPILKRFGGVCLVSDAHWLIH
jgi:hypothetical protein